MLQIMKLGIYEHLNNNIPITVWSSENCIEDKDIRLAPILFRKKKKKPFPFSIM